MIKGVQVQRSYIEVGRPSNVTTLTRDVQSLSEKLQQRCRLSIEIYSYPARVEQKLADVHLGQFEVAFIHGQELREELPYRLHKVLLSREKVLGAIEFLPRSLRLKMRSRSSLLSDT